MSEHEAGGGARPTQSFLASPSTQGDLAEVLISAMLDGVAVLSRSGELLEASARFCEMTGFTREELVGARRPFPHWPVDQHERMHRVIDAVLTTGVGEHDVVFQTRDGRRIDVILSAAPIRDDSGVVVGYVETVKDVSSRRRDEERLRASEERARSIVQTAVDAIITIHEDNAIETFNPAAERMFGYRADEVIGKNVSMLMTEPDRSAHDGYVQRYLATGEARIIGLGRDVVGLRKDGSRFPLHLSVGEMTVGGRRMFTGILKDVTGLQDAEALLRASEERARSMVETAVDAIIAIHEDGTIDAFNPAAERMFGYGADEVLGENVRMLMPEPDHSAHDEYLRRYLRTGERHIIGIGRDVVGRRRDGTVFPMHLSVGEMTVGGRRMFTGVIRDVTEVKLAERRLRESEEAARRQAEEHEAIGRLATAVAQEASPEDIFAAAAEEAARLSNAAFGLVLRADDGRLVVVGAHGIEGLDGHLIEDLDAVPPLSRAVAARRTVHAQPDGVASLLEALGDPEVPPLFSATVSPVAAGRHTWGLVLVASGHDDPASPERLSRFAHLVGLAVTNAESRQELERRALTDVLTGLPNRAVFTQALEAEMDRFRRHGRGFGVILLDIDHFKRVNDTHGHQVGDLVLTELARRLSAAARPEDTIARLGGEEFAWIAAETDSKGAMAAAERVRRRIAALPMPLVGTVTVSVGVAAFDERFDADELVRAADVALYEAKARGRNQSVLFEDEPRGSSAPA